MFMIWNNCCDQGLSESSFVGFTNTLVYSQPYHGNNPHIGFFRKAMVTMECGDRGFEAVCYQLSKDLRRIEGPFVFEPLIDCLTRFSKERWFVVRTSTQRSVLSHSMAAFRTQICSRKDSKRERMGWYLRYVTVLVVLWCRRHPNRCPVQSSTICRKKREEDLPSLSSGCMRWSR